MSNPGTATDTPITDSTTTPASDGAAVTAPVVETPDSSSPADGEAPTEAAAGAVVDTPAAASTPAEPEPARKPDWRDRRIAQLTAQLKNKPKEQQAGGDDGTPAYDEAEVNRRAAALAAQNDFNRRCNEVAQAGKQSFNDFDERVGNLQHLYTPGNPSEEAAYVALLGAALETDDPARVLYELGGDMDKAERLIAMSPVKLGMEMAKMAAKRGEPEPSTAPKPITPVGQRGQTHSEIDPADKAKGDQLSTRTWMERRQKYVEDQRKSGVRMA